jgi:hypothetical protein
MCAYCEAPVTLALIELGGITRNKHEYSYIKIENGRLVFRSIDDKTGTCTDIGRKAKFCIECGRKLDGD